MAKAHLGPSAGGHEGQIMRAADGVLQLLDVTGDQDGLRRRSAYGRQGALYGLQT